MAAETAGTGVTAPVKRVVVATNNLGKLVEIRSSLSFPGWEFVAASELDPAWPSPEENGETFEDNARIKACAAHERFGLAALADDSGLQVDALNGAPGVFSSRYAGLEATDAENNAKLLAELADVADANRTARFRSAIVFIDDDGTETVAFGVCEGVIATSAAGSGGFGYDPLFCPDMIPGRHMAELSLEEKNAISHRGAALRALHERLSEKLTR